ncbi:MAG: hypothetical protein P1T08_04695 [Acidimicrobiia bacterium]|nr:hypothetical protein [Acidimicrobiia bacterium]
MKLCPSFQARYRELTVVLLAASALLGLFAGFHSFSGPMTFGLIPWAMGLAASFLGVVLAGTAAVEFALSEDDLVDIRCALGVLAFGAGSLTTTGLGGLGALALLLAGWTTGRAGKRTAEDGWRAERADRRAFLARVRGTDARSDPEAERFLNVTNADLTERDRGRLAGDSGYEIPVTRRGARDRGRMIEGNPWQLPPE